MQVSCGWVRKRDKESTNIPLKHLGFELGIDFRFFGLGLQFADHFLKEYLVINFLDNGD
jgi:hypothetical protein